jgi:hypothetical protein
MKRRCPAEFDTAVIRALGHPQRQRAPATAQLQDALAVGQARALRVQLQHRVLGLGQGAVGSLEQAGAVLEPRPQAQLEEGRRQLVVLFVGGIDLDRHRAVAQGGEQLVLALLALLRATGMERAQALRAQPADAWSHQPVGNQAALGQGDQVHADGLGWARGGHGKKRDVSAW